MRESWRTAQSLCQSVLRCNGCEYSSNALQYLKALVLLLRRIFLGFFGGELMKEIGADSDFYVHYTYTLYDTPANLLFNTSSEI